jgi:hypothetical protein
MYRYGHIYEIHVMGFNFGSADTSANGIIQKAAKTLIKIDEIPKTWTKTNDFAFKPIVKPMQPDKTTVIKKE